jgi:hypothetical protein
MAFRDMETPEQRYAREQAATSAQRSRQAAHKHDGQAQREQMTVDVYGRQGKDYSDPAEASRAARRRDKEIKDRDRHIAEADRHQAIADSKPAKKSRWW